MKNFPKIKISLRNIVIGLAKTYRWGTKFKYPRQSVLDHSVTVGTYVSEPLTIYGLLHDASEAYIQDITPPFKDLMPDYKDVEAHIMNLIAKKYKLDYSLFKHPNIKSMDNYAAKKELRYFTFLEEEKKEYDETQAKQQFIRLFRIGLKSWRKLPSKDRKLLVEEAKARPASSSLNRGTPSVFCRSFRR